jgi:hypothetical protein
VYEAGGYYFWRKRDSELQTVVEGVENQIARTHQSTTNRNAGRIDKNSEISHMHRQFGQRFINEKAGANIRVSEEFSRSQFLSQESASPLTESAPTNGFFQR